MISKVNKPNLMKFKRKILLPNLRKEAKLKKL